MDTAPEIQVVRRKLQDLKPYPKNPRQNDHAIERMIASIREFGFKIPILARSDGTVIDGHLRLKAAEQLQLSEVPVILCDDWTDAQVKAFRLMVNRSVGWAEWDTSLLGQELHELETLEFDLALTGFDPSEIENLMQPAAAEGAGTEGADAVPEVLGEPVSRPGDVWILGKHRLMCGDSTVVTDVEKLMHGQRAVLMNTDPPYGINYGDIANSRDRAADKTKGGTGKDYHRRDDKMIENDDLDGAALQQFLEEVIRTALPFLIENPAFYLWHPMLTQGTFFAAAAAAAAAAADILIHRQIIWVKPSLIMGRGDYHWRHELCFYGWIRGKHCAWKAGRDQDTVWNVGRENDHIHPTQKPVELFRRPILNHTERAEICYEPFSGSGSQIIAAEGLGRRCYAMELAPAYVDVAVQRWQQFTGKEAMLEQHNQTFAEIGQREIPLERPTSTGTPNATPPGRKPKAAPPRSKPKASVASDRTPKTKNHKKQKNTRGRRDGR